PPRRAPRPGGRRPPWTGARRRWSFEQPPEAAPDGAPRYAAANPPTDAPLLYGVGVAQQPGE
ncbi:MAG: hypothetical protein OXJ53_06410, partial [Gammaproteobacteria bacterium]|nr:hypothetical protein [Gammaproteobacteria bacterium]